MTLVTEFERPGVTKVGKKIGRPTLRKNGIALSPREKQRRYRERLRKERARSYCEWYAPPQVIAAARAVLGTIDLDPASSIAANVVVLFHESRTSPLGNLIFQLAGFFLSRPLQVQGTASLDQAPSRAAATFRDAVVLTYFARRAMDALASSRERHLSPGMRIRRACGSASRSRQPIFRTQ